MPGINIGGILEWNQLFCTLLGHLLAHVYLRRRNRANSDWVTRCQYTVNGLGIVMVGVS